MIRLLPILSKSNPKNRMYFKASAVKATLASPPAGPCTFISNKSVVDEAPGFIQGCESYSKTSHSNTIAKSIVSADAEVSRVEVPLLAVSIINTFFRKIYPILKTSIEKIDIDDSVCGLEDFKASKKDSPEAKGGSGEIGGDRVGSSTEMTWVSHIARRMSIVKPNMNHKSCYHLLPIQICFNKDGRCNEVYQ